jgi:hypothetical protein
MDSQMQTKPVVDLRIYMLKQGGVPEFLRLSREIVLPVQLRHIGPPIAYYVTEIGPQQEVIHLWGYDSLGDMQTRREARNLDPGWPRYAQESVGLIEKQETTILKRIPLVLPDDAARASADKPLIEFRTTTVHRGSMTKYLQLLERQALPIQLQHVGAPFGLYVSDVGFINQVIQLTGFDNYADMEARRTARERDPAWSEYMKARESLMVAESLRMVRRAPGL